MKATLKNTVGNVYEMNNSANFSNKTMNVIKNDNSSSNAKKSNSRNSKKNSMLSSFMNGNNKNSNKNKNNDYGNNNGNNNNNNNNMNNNSNSNGNNNGNKTNNSESFQFKNMSNMNKNQNSPSKLSSFMNIVNFIIVFCIAVLIGMVIYFQDKILASIQTMIRGESDKSIKSNTNELVKRIDKLEKEIQESKTKKEVAKRPVKSQEEKKEDVKNYSDDQIVKNDGFCYVGYENGQRECAPVFSGDVCMSGEVFPRLDKCMVPKLRV